VEKSKLEMRRKDMFDYILFDLDGTLTNSKEGITKSVQYALKAFGIDEPDLDKLEPFIGPPLIDIFKDFYGFNDEEAKKAVEKYRERFTNIGIFENEVYPGIKEMLAKLKNEGKKLAVASSKPEVMVERILKHFEIDEYFDVVVGSELDGRRSRKEEVVEEAIRQLVPSDKVGKSVAMVGDRKFDIEGALEFGLTPIGVSYGFAPEGELEKAGAEYIVDTVEELYLVLC
jgi:phosphoglycolate phosphatase